MNDLKAIVEATKEKFSKSIDFLESELLKIRAGKANPAMLNGIQVDSYGAMSPLSAVCSITTPDPRTLVLQPWDKSQISAINRAIINANIGLNPQDDGQVIRINIPPLTEERRKDLVKQSKQEGEKIKVAIRNHRRDGIESLKKHKSDEGVSEDLLKSMEDKIQKLTDEFIAKVDQVLSGKEKEILSI
ncbi:MAG: ribosome recycling factor [Chitinophagales bacterium]|jgi:ribosome recycling factor|nr:ribosome recycling factor [Chitinophagales bacterium]